MRHPRDEKVWAAMQAGPPPPAPTHGISLAEAVLLARRVARTWSRETHAAPEHERAMARALTNLAALRGVAAVTPQAVQQIARSIGAQKEART
jgi:hypothetical protein